MADLIIEHCRKNKITWHKLAERLGLDFSDAREILLGEVEDKAFCELKETAEELGVKKIERLRYNRIKATMTAHYVSSKELAEHLDVHPSTVSSWAKNSIQPKLNELYALAAFFRCCPTELLG